MPERTSDRMPEYLPYILPKDVSETMSESCVSWWGSDVTYFRHLPNSLDKSGGLRGRPDPKHPMHFTTFFHRFSGFWRMFRIGSGSKLKSHGTTDDVNFFVLLVSIFFSGESINQEINGFPPVKPGPMPAPL